MTCGSTACLWYGCDGYCSGQEEAELEAERIEREEKRLPKAIDSDDEEVIALGLWPSTGYLAFIAEGRSKSMEEENEADL